MELARKLRAIAFVVDRNVDDTMRLLAIQIPCFNEAITLPAVLADLPKSLPGIDKIIIIVVDDGSADHTSQVAAENGADLIIRQSVRRGLSHAFSTGLEAALMLGADIIVNTDGDHQYPGRFVANLIEPIIRNEADVVIGDRNTSVNPYFSHSQQLLHRVGNSFIRFVSHMKVRDITSGFRAYSRVAASCTQVHSTYSYTIETLIKLEAEKITIIDVPIETNLVLRPSRLKKNIVHYLFHQSVSILQALILYQPMTVFGFLSLVFLIGYIVLLSVSVLTAQINVFTVEYFVRLISDYAVFLIASLLTFMLGLVCEAIRANRKIEEEILRHSRYLFGRPSKSFGVEQSTESQETQTKVFRDRLY
jgi:glycosyltransferase involved in cell wall biosynthesis